MNLRALVANPLPSGVPGNPFGVGTAERVVIAFIIFIIFIIVRVLVTFKRGYAPSNSDHAHDVVNG